MAQETAAFGPGQGANHVLLNVYRSGEGIMPHQVWQHVTAALRTVDLYFCPALYYTWCAHSDLLLQREAMVNRQQSQARWQAVLFLCQVPS